MEQKQVASSSTSNSKSRPWLLTVLAALGIVVAVELALSATSPVEASALEKLNTQPGEDVFVFGNSMFQTGINFAPLAEMSERSVAFDYHNGHYTSLWYLIADQALPLAEPSPNLVIWGFRPGFAADPAFRQNREIDNELFEPGDDIYKELTIGSGEVIDDSDLVGRLRETLLDSPGLGDRRDSAQGALARNATNLGVDVVGVVRSADTQDFRERLAAGETVVTDEILRIATDGEVSLAEERVVDTQGDFITGPRVDFNGSFLPHITERIADSAPEQLVIIWKPVHTVRDDLESAEDDVFVEDAIAYFEANGIPYLNLYDDDRITLDMFASGDHYNESGRNLVTSIVAQRISELAAS